MCARVYFNFDHLCGMGLKRKSQGWETKANNHVLFTKHSLVYVERFEMLCGSALQFGKCSCYISEWEQNSLGGDIV